MKGICDADVLWRYDKTFIFELVTRVNTHNFMKSEQMLETLPVSYALFLDLRDPFFKMLPVAIFLGKLL